MSCQRELIIYERLGSELKTTGANVNKKNKQITILYHYSLTT